MDFDELRKLAKTSLSAYASIMHHDWNPNWHHRVIARMLERFANNEPGWGKIILSLPPRSGKTELVSKLFPGWFMANHPHENVIVATYGGELSDDLGRKAREYASTELFESVMGCRISADTNAITKWELDNRSSFFATSVGGALTGKGAHCLTGDAKIATDRGSIRVDDLFLSPIPVKILSYGKNGLEFKNAEAFQRSTTTWIYRITTSEGRVVEATGDHRFHVEGRGWVKAHELASGDTFLCAVREGVYSDYIRNEKSNSEKVRGRVLQRPLLRDAPRDEKQPGARLFKMRGVFGGWKAYCEKVLRQMYYCATGRSWEETSFIPETNTESMRDVQHGIPGRLEKERKWFERTCQILLSYLCRCRPLRTNEGGGEPAIRTRAFCTEKEPVQTHDVPRITPSDSSEGWGEMCYLRSYPWVEQDDKKGAAGATECTSLGYEPSQQRGNEPRDTVQIVSHQSTQCREFRTGYDHICMVEVLRKECFVYDIQVADNHNFFANEVLVHNCLIVDDPVRSREDADSESARQKTWDWFTSTAYTRLEKGGRVLIVMTRWSSDDLAGRLLESNTGWREVKFPAIAEEDDEFRKAGDPLWPDKYPLEKLHEIRAQIGMRDWASLYQQRPAPQDGDIFRSEWMRTYPSLDHLERTGVVFEAVYQSWDTAVSGKSSSARSACTTWGVSGGKYYLLHTYAEPLSFPELRAKALELAQQWEPDMIYIEEQQTGRPLIDELKRHLGNRMTAIRPKGTKEARARAASVLFETGKVHLPEDAPWLASYVQELLGFPAGKFMDRVDSTSLILNALMKQYRNGGGAYVADNPYQGFGRQKMPNIYSR